MCQTVSTPSPAILLSVQMLADALEELSWDFVPHLTGDSPRLRGCLLYCGQSALQADLLYVVPEEAAGSFPADDYCYLTPCRLPGAAPHLDRIDQPLSLVLNEALDIFQQYRDFELQLCSLVTDNGSLSDLCRLGSKFFHNPMYIHDDMFSVVAMSGYAAGMVQFEYNEKTGRVHIPLWLIDDFKFDAHYRETLSMRHAALWGVEHYPQGSRTLYVNLWDGSHYRGRLLINEIASPLQPGQFQLAEDLAAYCVRLLRRDDQRSAGGARQNFEQIFVDLLTKGATDQRDLHAMLDILGWKPGDRYLCMELQRQNTSDFVNSDSALNSRLAAVLQGYASFYYNGTLCIVVNLSHSGSTPKAVRKLLAPHVRDSYMFGGISNPIAGITNIQYGFRQAEIALDFILQSHSSQWLVPFSHCALSYVRRQAVSALPPALLADPSLLELQALDRQKGTEYYETLEHYLFLERNISKTAESLNIHRTTLTYRLDKIQELLHLDLEDHAWRLYLLFSFYLLSEEGRSKTG